MSEDPATYKTGKNAPASHVQLELAALYPLRDKADWSRSIPVYDALPKFLLSNTKRFEPGEKLMSMVYPKFSLPDGRIFDFTVIPGNVADKDGHTKTYMPGIREDHVAKAIRYLSTQELTPMGYYVHKKEGPSFRVTFTLYQIIQLLKEWGHTYNNEEVDQALWILTSASLTLKPAGSSRAFFHGSIYADYSGCDDSEDPRDKRRQVLLNRLEYDAICTGAFHALNIKRMMAGRTSPLAQSIYMYLVIWHRNASKPPKNDSDPLPPPCKFSSDDILKRCGIKPQQRFRQTLERIRAALIELGDAGTLWRRENTDGSAIYFDEEEILGEPTGGRRGVIGANWSVWLSASAVQEFIDSHNEAVMHSDTYSGRQDPVLHRLPETQKISQRKKAQRYLP